MTHKLVGLLVLATALGVGCNGGTPGGPGAKDSNGKKVGSDDTFTLTVPTLSTTLTQEETKTASVGISRGKNFGEDVALKITNVPKGLTIDPASPVIKHGDTDAKITLKAAPDAAVGDFTLHIVGHPTKGADATNDMKLTIKKK